MPPAATLCCTAGGGGDGGGGVGGRGSGGDGGADGGGMTRMKHPMWPSMFSEIESGTSKWFSHLYSLISIAMQCSPPAISGWSGSRHSRTHSSQSTSHVPTRVVLVVLSNQEVSWHSLRPLYSRPVTLLM